MGKGSIDDYKKLAARIEALEKQRNLSGNRVFYLALPPEAFSETISGLGEAGLNKSKGWTRIVVEKPFGQNLESVHELNKKVRGYFDESQIYRIDHFLGKETVQNLLVFRFANTIFEKLWNRENIESVSIVVAESEGIEGRANYYEQTGALRDMVVNHLTQLLALVAMEIPATFGAEDIRDEKVKILRQITPIQHENIVSGQYSKGNIGDKSVIGYTEELGIPQNSQTETFVALKLEIANWRWKGVPFYLCTGKRMPRRLTQIIINFHCAPINIFKPFDPSCIIEPNALTITLQPDEGFHLQFHVKAIGQPIKLTTQSLHFHYSNTFGTIPDAYETLLLDVITGDQTLFVRSDEAEGAWRNYNSLLNMKIQIHPYPAGTWSPPEANRLLPWKNKVS